MTIRERYENVLDEKKSILLEYGVAFEAVREIDEEIAEIENEIKKMAKETGSDVEFESLGITFQVSTPHKRHVDVEAVWKEIGKMESDPVELRSLISDNTKSTIDTADFMELISSGKLPPAFKKCVVEEEMEPRVTKRETKK